MAEHAAHSTAPKVYGLVAEFDDPDQLLEAATKAYKAGYRQMDAYSPFPVHGLSEAIGFKKCGVAPITLIGGLTGTFTAWFMQYFASTIHYRYDIGGKPFNSWPSFVPIMFELTILFGAFSALGSMLILNGLPMHWHPIFGAKRFERASSDGFFLCVESADRQYDPEKTKQFLNDLGPVEVSEVLEEVEAH